MAQRKKKTKASRTKRGRKPIAKPNRPKLNGHLHRQNGSKKRTTQVRPLPQEVAGLYERARWRKERREYWKNRFRRLVANIGNHSKAKAH